MRRTWQPMSGVVFSFADCMRAVCDTERGGTAARNRHPIAVLFASKIADLTGQSTDGVDVYSRAYDACKTLARGDD